LILILFASQHRKARRLDAVVIGDQNAIQHNAHPKTAAE
jgi:hypothetical protein